METNRWFDFFYEDRGSKVTFVVFPAAVPSSFETYPFFTSRSMAEKLGANYLCFADPSVGGNEGLSTFWYLNTRRVRTQTLVPAIVRHALQTGSGEKLLFFGSSAGGFGALMYSSMFPSSSCLVMNPRIDLLVPPVWFDEYASFVYPGWDTVKLRNKLPTNVAKFYALPPGNRVVYLQNRQDKNYFENHYPQFSSVVKGRSDAEFVLGDWGVGHVVPPRDEYMPRLRRMVARLLT
ncbi:hypothetical protein [Glutamicibacter uratoxydans]|uniref:hypothetical protein n=1 Tax=Glutamicibacter uratoxydans TaxID=43667 RepID=UPI003D6E0CC4